MAKQISRLIKRVLEVFGFTVIAMFLIMPCSNVFSDIILNDGQVHINPGINQPPTHISVFNNINPPYNSTTMIISGFYNSGGGGIDLHQDSLLAAFGANIAGGISSFDSSVVDLEGSVQETMLKAGGNSIVILNNSGVDGLVMGDHSTLFMEDSVATQINFYDNSMAFMNNSGSRFGGLKIGGNAIVYANNISDSMSGGERVGEAATLDVTEGFISGDFCIVSGHMIIHGQGFNVPSGTYTAASGLTYLEGPDLHIGSLSIVGTGVVTLVPEPSTMLLLGSGLIGLLGYGRRFLKK